MYMVIALSPHTYISHVVTNKKNIDNYEFSDIGQQIGFTILDKGVFNTGSNDRKFTDDCGLTGNSYNRHLVFSSKVEAEAYAEFVKNSVELISENQEYQERLDIIDECLFGNGLEMMDGIILDSEILEEYDY